VSRVRCYSPPVPPFFFLSCFNPCSTLTPPHTGTYGGHLELSAFAHLSQRNVKVIQPGLVYVIEWAGGGGGDLSSPTTIPSPTIPGDPGLDEREKRRLRRNQKRGTRARASSSATAADQDEEEEEENIDPAAGAVYVAYVLSTPDPC
jgi:OTU domain-containing protein 3